MEVKNEELIRFDWEHEFRDDDVSKASVIHHQSDSSSSLRSKPSANDAENESNLSQSGSLRKKVPYSSPDWKHQTKEELMTLPIVEVQRLRIELSRVVEEVSSELVRLLQERHSLQEEVDIRNIAIEQLWKVQEKLQWRFTEPQLGIQMGVIFPSEDNETIDCN